MKGLPLRPNIFEVGLQLMALFEGIVKYLGGEAWEVARASSPHRDGEASTASSHNCGAFPTIMD